MLEFLLMMLEFHTFNGYCLLLPVLVCLSALSGWRRGVVVITVFVA